MVLVLLAVSLVVCVAGARVVAVSLVVCVAGARVVGLPCLPIANLIQSRYHWLAGPCTKSRLEARSILMFRLRNDLNFLTYLLCRCQVVVDIEHLYGRNVTICQYQVLLRLCGSAATYWCTVIPRIYAHGLICENNTVWG